MSCPTGRFGDDRPQGHDGQGRPGWVLAARTGAPTGGTRAVHTRYVPITTRPNGRKGAPRLAKWFPANRRTRVRPRPLFPAATDWNQPVGAPGLRPQGPWVASVRKASGRRPKAGEVARSVSQTTMPPPRRRPRGRNRVATVGGGFTNCPNGYSANAETGAPSGAGRLKPPRTPAHASGQLCPPQRTCRAERGQQKRPP